MGGAKPLVPVIVGPTAVGKTALGESLADRWPITVISADSRQIYRGLDIGTAKPPLELLERVPHVGLNLVAPGERYSAGQFARDAVTWLSEIGTHRRPILLGGTGFYIRALVDGLFREPPMDPAMREKLRGWVAGLENAGRWAMRLDSGYGGGGKQRAARTIEVALLTGRPLSEWQRRARAEGVMRPWYVRLTAPRQFLHARIEERTRRMLDMGLVAEVQELLQSGLSPGSPGLNGVGYREVIAHLTGELAEVDLCDAIARSTKGYAKRQETWFRHQLEGHPVITLDATDPPNVLADRVVELWEERKN